MRSYFAGLMLVVILIVPAVSFAAAPPLLPKKCTQGGSTGDPSGTKEFSTSQVSELEAHLNTVIYCANACYEETITFTPGTNSSGSPTLKIDTTATSGCATKDRPDLENPERGCAEGQKQPKVTANISAVKAYGITLVSAQTIDSKSRCNENISSIVGNILGRLEQSDLDGFKEDLEALRNLPSNAPATALDTATNGALSTVLEGLGLDTATIDRIAQHGQTQAALDAIARGDQDALKTALERSGIDPDKLNSNVRENIAKLSQLDPRVTATPVGGVSDEPANVPSNTGFQTTQTTPTGGGTLDQAREAIAAIESRGSGGYSAVGPRTRSGHRAYGRYQVMDFNIPSWTREALGRAMSVREFLNCASCQDQVFNFKFSQYANKYGGYENAARVWFGGPGALRNGGASDGYTTVDAYAARFSSLLGTTVPFGGESRAYTGGNSSPFGSLNPFNSLGGGDGVQGVLGQLGSLFGGGGSGSSGGGSSGGGSSGSGGGRQIPNQQPVSQVIQPNPLIPVVPTNNTTQGSDPQTVQPVAVLVLQPIEVVRGNPFNLSWSSVGMSATKLCSLYLSVGGTNTLIAQKNEGSQTFETNTASTPETWEFTLQCTAQSGAILERNASILVQ